VQEFAIRTEQLDPQTVVIALQGEVDLSNAPVFEELLTARIELGARHVVVDLRETAFFDSTALRVLLAGNRELNRLGGKLSVVCAEPRIRKIFTVTGLEDVFPFNTTIEQALAGSDESSETFDPVP
jgi:anti-sigma B factor antagonist